MSKNTIIAWVLVAAAVMIAAFVLFRSTGDNASAGNNPAAGITVNRGEKMYKSHCLSCHQQNGTGVPSMYPPLKDNPRVLGNKENLVGVMLKGQQGRIEVNGQIYNGMMPAYDYLTDGEIADLLTYIRSKWGNSASTITKDQVAEIRENIN